MYIFYKIIRLAFHCTCRQRKGCHSLAGFNALNLSVFPQHAHTTEPNSDENDVEKSPDTEQEQLIVSEADASVDGDQASLTDEIPSVKQVDNTNW